VRRGGFPDSDLTDNGQYMTFRVDDPRPPYQIQRLGVYGACLYVGRQELVLLIVVLPPWFLSFISSGVEKSTLCDSSFISCILNSGSEYIDQAVGRR